MNIRLASYVSLLSQDTLDLMSKVMVSPGGEPTKIVANVITFDM